jgi:predicted enzyme involved in methoxymalonyl-ACP biosynthesis
VLAGEHRADAFRADVWVLSCRAFSRRVEEALVASVFADPAVREIQFDYRATGRNGPTAHFLERLLGAVPADGWVAVTREQFAERAPRHHLAVTGATTASSHA